MDQLDVQLAAAKLIDQMSFGYRPLQNWAIANIFQRAHSAAESPEELIKLLEEAALWMHIWRNAACRHSPLYQALNAERPAQ